LGIEKLRLADYAGLHYWWFCNCGKKSLCIDLSKEKSVQIVHEMAKKCDVVVESFRPGVMDRLGVGYASLRKVNPRIIMCSLSAFGQDSPYTRSPGTAVVAHAMSGIMWLQGKIVNPDGPPLPPPFAIGDIGASLHATSAICAALYFRERTGTGQYIDISLIDSLFGMNDRVQQQMLQQDELQSISATPIYTGKDGYVTIQGVGQVMLARLWKAMGRGELSADNRFDTIEHRTEHIDELNQIIEEWVQSFDSVQQVIPILEKADVVCAPILSIDEASKHPHLVARKMLGEIDDPERGKVRVPNSAFRFSETKSGIRGNLPRLGEHNLEILGLMLDYSAEQVVQLQDEGVIYSDLRGYSLEEIISIENKKGDNPKNTS
jgi:CoA:oxalate CoA-transferase